MNRLRCLMFAVLLTLVAGVTVMPAFAYADVNSLHLTCSTFSASGTTNQDYIEYYLYNNTTSEQLAFASKPTHGGHFSISLSFDKQPVNSNITLQVWASPTSFVGAYDGEAWLDTDKKCKSDSGSGDTDTSAGPPAGNLFDGRINNTDQSRDVAAPIAIYRDSAGTIDIYAIDPSTGAGSKALTLSTADMNAQGIPTEGSLTLGGTTVNGAHIVVSRLTTGELQVNVSYGGGQTYVVVWLPDNPGALYHPG